MGAPTSRAWATLPLLRKRREAVAAALAKAREMDGMAYCGLLCVVWLCVKRKKERPSVLSLLAACGWVGGGGGVEWVGVRCAVGAVVL